MWCLQLVAAVVAAESGRRHCTDGSELTSFLGFAASGSSLLGRDATFAHWRRFEGALRARGATVDVEIGMCGSRRGLRAARDAAAGEAVLVLPKRLVLDAAYADARDVSALWRDRPLAPMLKVALFLLHEVRARERAETAPYTMLLARDARQGDDAPAFLWRREDLARFRCDAVEAACSTKRAWAQEAAAEPAAAGWAAAGLPGPPPTAEEVLWAVGTVASRAVDWPGAGSSLAPLIDMTNHDAEPTARVHVGTAAVALVAVRAVKAGDELTTTYSSSPLTLLSQYGVVDDGDADPGQAPTCLVDDDDDDGGVDAATGPRARAARRFRAQQRRLARATRAELR